MNSQDHNIFGRSITGELQKHKRAFISHRMADKVVARRVAEYFEFLGLHYYFDEQDAVLQQMLKEGHSDDRALVESIDAGLAHSSHVLAVLSERTMGSWWVPYEIGSGRARGFDIAHLLLPSIRPEMVPEYLRIYPQLWTSEDLFTWAKELIPWLGTVVHRFYSEWLDGSGPFAELGPDEEDVEMWYQNADRQNARFLQQLDTVLRDNR